MNLFFDMNSILIAEQFCFDWFYYLLIWSIGTSHTSVCWTSNWKIWTLLVIEVKFHWVSNRVSSPFEFVVGLFLPDIPLRVLFSPFICLSYHQMCYVFRTSLYYFISSTTSHQRRKIKKKFFFRSQVYFSGRSKCTSTHVLQLSVFVFFYANAVF